MSPEEYGQMEDGDEERPALFTPTDVEIEEE